MASLHRKPYIIALQLQLCTGRDSSYSRAGGGVTREKGARSMGEEKKKGKIIIIIINKKLTCKINNYEEKRGKKNIYRPINNTHPCPILFRNHFMLGNNFGVFKVFIITVRYIIY